MPFTLSHPAAVIPIRKYGVLSALVIGSMMPDTLYFLPGDLPHGGHDSYGHSLPGLFLYCVPVGVALLWLFHKFMKKPLISLFPRRQHGKLLAASPAFNFWPMKRFSAIVFSVLIGAASHLTWDSFTHGNGWVAARVDFFHHFLPLPWPFHLQVTEALQYGGSVFGLMVIAYYYRRWLRHAPQQSAEVRLPSAIRVVMLCAFAVGAAAPAAARFALDPEFWIHFRRGLIGYGAVDGIKVVSVEMLAFCVAWHIAFRGRPGTASPMSHSSEA